ncbi:MAG TPA: hypothetical protein VK422_21335 [Pyrinomonadaceae bacterium]|nr:hypothetical protein [Pyrinomonadaceae bacterium]
MASTNDTERHLLPTRPRLPLGFLRGGAAVKHRRLLYASVIFCALAVAVPVTHMLISKIHFSSRGGRMRAKLYTLLRHLSHLGPEEFEALIAGTLRGQELQQVETHLRICPVCREEVAIVRESVFAPEALAGDGRPAAGAVSWGAASTLWLDDETYALRPLGSACDRALAEGLSFDLFERMARKDSKEPGTHMLSIEGGAIEVIAPLSAFVRPRAAEAAGGGTPALSHRAGGLVVEVSTDNSGAVIFTARRPPARPV